MILDKYNSHVIVTKNIYLVRYCNKRKLNKKWLEAKVNLSKIKKLDILVISSLRSTSTGLSPKNFEKRAHPTKKFHENKTTNQPHKLRNHNICFEGSETQTR